MFNERIHQDANRHLSVVNTLTLPLGGTGVSTKEQAQAVLDVADESVKLTPGGLAVMPEDEQLGVWTEGGAGAGVTVRGPFTIFANTTSIFTISNFDINTPYFISASKGEIWRDMSQVYLKTDGYTGEITITINGSGFSVESQRVLISKPTPTNLQDRQVNVGSNFLLRMSPYVSATNTTFHKSSDWQLSKDPSFNVIEAQVLESTDTLLSWPVKDLQPDTQYYVRSRYRDNVGNASDWSETTTFHTRESFAPLTPSVQWPAQGSMKTGANAVVQCSDFETTEIGSTHASSDWELSTSSVFNGTISESASDKTSLTDWEITGLSENTMYYVRVRYTDDKGRTSQWSDAHSFKTRLSFGANTPRIESPTSGVTEQNSHVELTSSAFDHDEPGTTHASSDWEVSEDATFAYPQFQSQSNGKALKEWGVEKLKPDTQYYARVRYRDNNGSLSNWSQPVSFKTKLSFAPRKPAIVFPTHRATDGTYAMNFRSDIFVSGDLGSSHHSSDWELSTNSAFTNVVKSAMQTMNNKTQWSVNRLDSAALYFLRVRYRCVNSGVLTESEWSDVVSFSVKDIAPGVPGIMTPVNGMEVDYLGQLSFTASAFVEGMVGETHASSDWQLSLTANFSTIFKTDNASTAYKTNWAVTGLDAGQTYYVRVKYRASTGRQSVWSPVTTIRTKDTAQAVVPSVTSPNDGTKNAATDSIRFSCSAFDIVLDGDSHESTDWELAAESSFQSTLENSYASTNNKTSWLVYGLANSTDFYVRVRHRGSKSGDTRWSTPVKFTTKAAAVIAAPGTPEITYPVEGSSKNGLSPTIRASSFFSENQSDTHLNSDWELATDPTFAVIEKSIYTSVGYKTTWSLADLFANTIYYVRVRYRGTVGGQSEWSETQTFKTGTKVVSGGIAGVTPGTNEEGVKLDPSRPTVKYPSTETNKDIPTTVTFLSSDFKSSSSDVHSGSQWTLVDHTLTNVVKDSTLSNTHKTAWTVEGLEQDTAYGISVKHVGENMGGSLVSAVVPFTTTLYTTIAKPVIVFPTAIGKIAGLMVEASVFSTTKEGQNHDSSDWELFDDKDTMIYSLYDNKEQKTTLALGTLFAGLLKDKTVKIRVRYKGPGGMTERSLWSEKTSFKLTDQDITLPAVILSPIAADKLPSQPYVAVTVDTFASTNRAVQYVGLEVELSSTAEFTAATTQTHTFAKDSYLDGTTPKTVYLKCPVTNGDLYIRAKIFGSDGNEPNYSAVVAVKIESAIRPLKEVGRIKASDCVDTSDYFGFSIDLDKEGRFVIIGDPTTPAQNPQPPYGDESPTPRGWSFVFRRVGEAWQNRIASRTPKEDMTGFANGTEPYTFYANGNTWWGETMIGKSVCAGTTALCQSFRLTNNNPNKVAGGSPSYYDCCVWATFYTTGMLGTPADLKYPRILRSSAVTPVQMASFKPKGKMEQKFIDAYTTGTLDGKTLNNGIAANDNGYAKNSPHSGNSIAISRDDSVLATGVPMMNVVQVVTNWLSKVGHSTEADAWHTQAKKDVTTSSIALVDKERFIGYQDMMPNIKYYELHGSSVPDLNCEDGWPVISGPGEAGLLIERDSTYFGISTALNGDGTILYVGCLGKAAEQVAADGTGTCSIGHVLKYKFNGTKWELVGKVSGKGYGMDVDCDSSGDYFVTGGFKEVYHQYVSDAVTSVTVFPRRPQAKQSVSVKSTTGTMVYGRMGEPLKEIAYLGQPQSTSLEFGGYGGSSKSPNGLSRTPGAPNKYELQNAFPYGPGLDPRYLRELRTGGNKGFDVHFGKKVAMTDDGVPVSAGRDYIQYDNGYIHFNDIYPVRDIAISGDGKYLAVSTGSYREDSQIIIYGI